jgi:hypothetical protein
MASTGLDLLQSGEALLALAEATLHRLKSDMAGACAAKVKATLAMEAALLELVQRSQGCFWCGYKSHNRSV